MRLLIHTGFHKTGTSSIQHGLLQNHDILKHHLQVFTYQDIARISNAARVFSADLTGQKLRRFCIRLHKFLARLDPTDPRPVIVSSEDLCGHMPGREGLTSYTAAPILMRALTMTCLQTLGNETDLTLFLTTRAPEAWLKSCYAQHQRVIRLTQSWEDYRAAYTASADLPAIVARIKKQAGTTPVITSALEDSQTQRFGPLTPMLDLLDLPQTVLDQLTCPPRANPSEPKELLNLYLEANRSDLSDKALRDSKVAARNIWLQSLS